MHKLCDSPAVEGLVNLTQISDYRLGKQVGAGNYATVNHAVHISSEFEVAVKVYCKTKLQQDSVQLSFVRREIAALRKAEHASLPLLYDVIDSPSQLYIVMEFVSGANLGTLLPSQQQQPVVQDFIVME